MFFVFFVVLALLGYRLLLPLLLRHRIILILCIAMCLLFFFLSDIVSVLGRLFVIIFLRFVDVKLIIDCHLLAGFSSSSHAASVLLFASATSYSSCSSAA